MIANLNKLIEAMKTIYKSDSEAQLFKDIETLDLMVKGMSNYNRNLVIKIAKRHEKEIERLAELEERLNPNLRNNPRSNHQMSLSELTIQTRNALIKISIRKAIEDKIINETEENLINGDFEELIKNVIELLKTKNT